MDFSGWEKLSLVDFDDYVTTTLFCSHCNFRCPFCHNGALVLGQEVTYIPWPEIKEYLIKRQGVLEGVCVSGGEPTLMDDILSKLSEIKSLGYKVKLDTNGYRPEIIEEAIENKLVDYIAMDIKNSPERYAKTAGLTYFEVERIKRSIDLIMNSGLEYEFRTTIIKEFHDERSIKEAAWLIKGAKRYFLQMYIDREGCLEHGFHAFDRKEAERLCRAAEEFVPSVKLRNYD